MAAFFGNSSFDVRERNSVAITLNIHTKSHTVRGRPTLKLVERFGNGSVRELYERSIYERSFTSELSIEKYLAKPAISNELSNIMFTCKHNRVFRRDREPSKIPEATLKRLRRKAENWRNCLFVQAYRSPLVLIRVRHTYQTIINSEFRYREKPWSYSNVHWP